MIKYEVVDNQLNRKNFIGLMTTKNDLRNKKKYTIIQHNLISNPLISSGLFVKSDTYHNSRIVTL